jgi:hypothetical protein
MQTRQSAEGTHMRKSLTSSLAPALTVFLAMTVLAACGGTDGATDTTTRAPAESRAKSDTWATSASPTTGAHTETTHAGTTKVPQADTYGDGSTTAPSPAPTITEVRIDPGLPQDGAFYSLPAGSGLVRLMTAADNADRVRYFLVPTGTGTRDLAEQIGEATSSEADGRTWWVYEWSYSNQAMLAHLLVEATGPGGSTEQTPFGFYHEN